MIHKVLCFLLIAFSYINADVILWDVNGVLIDVNSNALFSSYSLTDRLKGYCSAATFFFRHPLTNFKQNLKECYFNALNQVPYQSQISYNLYSDDGVTPLPSLLKDLMLGYITYQEAKNLWNASSKPDILNKIFELNFNPERFIAAQKPLPAIKLLQKCAQVTDANGNKKHVCILISNWAADGVVPFKKAFANTIMPYIDCCIFSGEIHCSKPDHAIYEYCYDTVKKNFPGQLAENWFFIDDQKVNRDAAEQCLNGLICTHPDGAEKILHDNGVIA